MKKPNYKTTRKYKCPYCDFKATRGDLVDHVDKEHSDLLPEEYSAARAVYDFINGRNYNTCMICCKKVYKWNDKCHRYYNLCDDPKCREEVRRIALERHIKVYNKPTLLNDPEHQEKMLANRKISGSYTFSDGGKVTYTGRYEKNALEFIDKILEIPSRDIQAPGPVLEYNYNGTVHRWITDIYYIPANLLIEVKDGGSNPNNRTMKVYREKQIAKEEMITDVGTFNYIRLTNNQFEQLLAVLADMKSEALKFENPKAVIHINEEVGGIPPHRSPEAYIVPYGINNVFDGFAYSDSTEDEIIIPDNECGFVRMGYDEFSNKYNLGPSLYYTGKDIHDRISHIRESLINNTKSSPLFFANEILGIKLNSWQEVFFAENLRYFSKEYQDRINTLIENAVIAGAENYQFRDSNVVEVNGDILICRSPKGYYAVTPDDFYMASPYYATIEDLKSSDILSFMNNVYKTNTPKKNTLELMEV